MSTQHEYAEVFALPTSERLQLVEDLWDSLIPLEVQIPVPQWVVNELRERKKRFRCRSAVGYDLGGSGTKSR